MSLTKFASFEVSEVLDVKSTASRAKTASLRTLSDFHDYRTDDGYMYVRIRAISSRTNKNHDGWPTIELAGGSEAWDKISSKHQASEGGFRVEADTNQEYGYPTFIGKPIFIDHNNSDPKRARGVIVDSAFNVVDTKTAASDDDYWGSDDVDPEHNPPSEVELLLEVDAKSFPVFAKAIVKGDLDGFSMGCDVDYSKCSHCGNKASSPDEYCDHIVMKGAEHSFTSATGERQTKRSYENCYGIKFFEISGVFDPADETALTKEVRSSIEKEAYGMKCPTCHGVGQAMPAGSPGNFQEGGPCPSCHGSGEVQVPQNSDGVYMLDQNQTDPQLQPQNGPPIVEQHPGGQGWTQPGYTHELPPHLRRQLPAPNNAQYSSYLGARTAAIKQADNPEPQAMQVHAPEDVDTLREEKVCPLCGSDIDAEKCAVCGYEEPPESLQNPDLQQAQQTNELLEQGDGNATIPPDPGAQPETPPGAPAEAQGEGESYLNARKPQPTASVTSDMRWAPKQIHAASPTPQGDEPDETVTSDQTVPVTSALRTAKDLIAKAKRNQEENHMSDRTKVAADPADASGKAKKRVNVEGVGGVDESSVEQASKADARVDVEGKGGVLQDSNAEASKPDSTESITETSDNAGFDKGHRTQDSGPTKTWDNSNEPGSAVTDKAFPTAAAQGAQPADAVGKADKRIDVEEPPHDQTGADTSQWTGTDGNGVTRQQNPVTNVPTKSQGIKSNMVSLAAIKLADTEVELGVTAPADKWNRLTELAELEDSEIEAEHRALARVKTAGLTRTASRGGASRFPSMKRIASEESAAPAPVNDEMLDSALFSR